MEKAEEVDIYDPDIPSADNFSGGIQYDPLLKDDRFSTIDAAGTEKKQSLHAKKKAKKSRKASVPTTPKTMRGGTNEIIPEVSERSGPIKSN